MVSTQLRAKIVLERLSWIRQMIANVRALPLGSQVEFVEDPRTAAAAESYLRRCLEALLDLGRHLLAKGFGRAAGEYKVIAHELQEVDVLGPDEANLLRKMAGYRNRLVHFYDEVSVEELYEICTKGLDDVERLTQALVQWLRTHPEQIDEAL